MNTSPFWPLVWKEYRVGRAFWLAMALMGLAAQAGVAWLAHRPAERNWWLYTIALMISAGFAVGIGGTLFAVEHEERTFGLLRVLPVRAKELGSAKLLCALVGLFSLLVALWLTAGALAGWQALPARDAGRLWGLWGLACAEGLAWGILCSLVIRSPLRATVSAVLGVTLANQAAVTLTRTHNLADMGSYIEAIPFRVALLVAVGALDIWLLPRWLAGRFPQAIVGRRARRTGSATKSAGGRQTPAPRWAAPLTRLMWQACCETMGSAWGLIGLGLASILACAVVSVVLLTGILDFGQVYDQPPVVGGSRLIPLFALMPFILMTALFGSLAFSLDPTWRARFLAEHGVSPRLVWLSRQIVWGGWLLALLAVAVVLTVVPWLIPAPNLAQVKSTWMTWDSPYTYNWKILHFVTADWQTQRNIFQLCNDDLAINAWLLWAMLFSAYAVAQLLSLVFRRRLLAAVFSLVLGCVAGCGVYLIFWLDVPWSWSVLPLAVACLAATWLRAPSWLFARPGLRPWLGPAVVIGVSLAWIAIAVPHYRANEIPKTEIDWPALAHSPADAADVRATIALYQRAFELYRGGPDPGSSADDYHQQVADSIAEASWHPSVWLPTAPTASWQISGRIYTLGNWLPTWAEACRERGQLDQALAADLTALAVAGHFDQCEPSLQFNIHQPSIRVRALADLRSWAGAPGQTAEQIRTAIHRLEEGHAAWPSPKVRLQPWYAAIALRIRDLPAALAADTVTGGAVDREAWIASRLPWERERSLRLLNKIASFELDRIGGIPWKSNENQEFSWMPLTFGLDWETRGVHILLDESWLSPQQIDDRDRFTQWMRTTPLIEEGDLPLVPETWLIATEETDYRATLIVLALEAWKIDHGQLPDRLDQLVPTELASLPLDPVYAKPFLYYPQGLAERGDSRILLSGAVEDSLDRPNPGPSFYPPQILSGPAIGRRPFVWSALGLIPGEQRVVANQLTKDNELEPYVAYYCVEPKDLTYGNYETGVLQAGRAYFVPQVEEKQP